MCDALAEPATVIAIESVLADTYCDVISRIFLLMEIFEKKKKKYNEILLNLPSYAVLLVIGLMQNR